MIGFEHESQLRDLAWVRFFEVSVHGLRGEVPENLLEDACAIWLCALSIDEAFREHGSDQRA